MTTEPDPSTCPWCGCQKGTGCAARQWPCGSHHAGTKPWQSIFCKHNVLAKEVKRLRATAGEPEGQGNCDDCGDGFRLFEVSSELRLLMEREGFSQLCGECLALTAAKEVEQLNLELAQGKYRDGTVCGYCSHSGVLLLETMGRLTAELGKSHKEVERLRKLEGTDDDPEHRCDFCGGRNISSWYADSDVWNQVAGDYSILCPICFCKLAEEAGVQPTAWRLSIEGDDPEVSKLHVRLHARLVESAELQTEVARLQAIVKAQRDLLAWHERGDDYADRDAEELPEEYVRLLRALEAVEAEGGE